MMLKDMFVGKEESAKAKTKQSGKSKRDPASDQLYSMLIRNLIGQEAQPPETAISVPQQQATSLLQGMAGSPAAAPLASRLSGSGGAAGFAPGSSFLPGAGQAGLQSRAQLGIPDRATNFPFAPGADAIKDIGIPPLKAAPGASKLEKKIEKADQAGKTGKADRLRARQ